MAVALKILFLVVGVAILLPFFTRKEYPVHKGIVVVTGASSGIGRHASEHLASSGYIVYCGVRKQTDADRIAALKNDNMIPLIMDVTSHESLVNAVDILKSVLDKRQLPFVALVNNAGISRRVVAEFHDISDVKRVFETNLFGLMDLTQMSLPLLRKSKGRIVMISSMAGSIATPMSSTYSASKFALEAYSDALRREIAAFDISVSIVKPAYVKSQIFQSGDVASAQVYEDDESREAQALYPSFFDEKYKATRHKHVSMASDPIVTSEAILHAISSKYPHTRYVVANVGGVRADILEWVVWALPDRVIDLIYATEKIKTA